MFLLNLYANWPLSTCPNQSIMHDQLGESKMLYKVYDIDSDVCVKSGYD